MCIRIYIFLFQTEKHRHKEKAKETKENRKTKETKEEKEKENVVVVNNSVENLTRYDDIVWEFALCTFNLHDQSTKRERLLKNNKLWKTVYICLLYLFDCFVYFNQDILVKTCSKNVFIYILYSPMEISMIHPSFPTFNIKMAEFCTKCFFDRMSTLSNILSWISKKIFQFSYAF